MGKNNNNLMKITFLKMISMWIFLIFAFIIFSLVDYLKSAEKFLARFDTLGISLILSVMIVMGGFLITQRKMNKANNIKIKGAKIQKTKNTSNIRE